LTEGYGVAQQEKTLDPIFLQQRSIWASQSPGVDRVGGIAKVWTSTKHSSIPSRLDHAVGIGIPKFLAHHHRDRRNTQYTRRALQDHDDKSRQDEAGKDSQ
jgi:hypothetical protein